MENLTPYEYFQQMRYGNFIPEKPCEEFENGYEPPKLEGITSSVYYENQ